MQWEEKLILYMHSKVSAIDFFLMQMGKKENCSKLQKAFLITTAVEPVGNVVGCKAQALCMFVRAFLCFVMHCVTVQPLILRSQEAYLT